MKNYTINDTNPSNRMYVNSSDITIDIRYDPALPSYILTTSPTMQAKNSLMYVQGHGEYYCYAGSYTRRQNMASYLIMLTLSGNELLDYEGMHYELSAGTFYWIDCMSPHYFRTMPEGQPRHAMWIHFNGFASEFYYRQFLRLNKNSHVCKLPDNSKIASRIKELIAMYNSSQESIEIDIAASAIVTSIVVECVKAATIQNTPSSVPKIILQCRSYIDSNYDKYITLDVLSDHLNVNKYYLQKLFKRYIGMSPSDYLLHVRITRAKELLRSSDNAISQIAREVGISDSGNFARLFKKYENCTPMEYRHSWIDPTLTVAIQSDD